MKHGICVATSSGGHLEQALAIRARLTEYETFVLTEKTKYNKHEKYSFVTQVNREEKLFLLKMLLICFQSFFIYLKHRPKVVICTGVLAMIPFCRIAKIFGSKLIYIESYAKISSPTMTGQHLHKHADAFIVQWEEMLQCYPDAQFFGGVY